MLSAHPNDATIPATDFLGKQQKLPMWVSSMTGGTKMAGIINRNLAQACREFGIGMGLGSCRIILDDDTYFADFDMRDVIGDDLPLYANLGINQVEILCMNKQVDKITRLVEKLRADGLFIHINPFQEWFQPEGDRLMRPPIESVQELLEQVNFPIIVKEVGQGMGLESLRALLKLPIAGVEFGAFGGTNFAKLELMRNNEQPKELFEPLSYIGHDAYQMVDMVNRIVAEEGDKIKCQQLIISGGIKSYLDGYYLIKKSKIPAIYGQASTFLKYALENYEPLREFISHQVSGLKMAYAYLRVRE
jgi:isopentenyl-diphosphate delta-isomerase